MLNKMLSQWGYLLLSTLLLFKIAPAQTTTSTSIKTYNQNTKANKFDVLSEKGKQKIVLFDERELKLKNFIIEFDVTPYNSDSKFGVISRYQNPKNWVYIGCDSTSDVLTHAQWNIRKPELKQPLTKDIVKFYKGFKRSVLLKLEEGEITVYVDGEKIMQAYHSAAITGSGALGIMAHDGGAVHVENVKVSALTPLADAQLGVENLTLRNKDMEVLFVKGYPAIAKYKLKKWDTEVLGKSRGAKVVTVNGFNYSGISKLERKGQRLIYHTKLSDIKVSFDTEFWLEGNHVRMAITNLQESGDIKVKTLAFPNHDLVTIPNGAANAQLSVAHGTEKDEFFNLVDKGIDTVSNALSIGILNTNKVALSILSNSSYNAEQVRYRTFLNNRKKYTSLFGEEWIIRGVRNELLPMPDLTVVISGDENKDQQITWQDAAVQLAALMPKPFGFESIRNAYATITMNFASGGQYPFLRQLDNIKKFYLATDGFPQLLELKGYQSEGHDSGHPDYADNYNTRAGGYDHLKALIAKARDFNAHIGVHINHSEAYPEAKAYTDRIMTDVPGWTWLDQAYLINKKRDIEDGTFEKRIRALKSQLPELSFVYLDTYREERSIAQYTSHLFNELKWSIWTEEPNVFYNTATWTHHVPDAKSLISRFILHQYRDGFAAHPLLLGGYNRGAEIGFMGWQKGRDFNQVINNFFKLQLPYRYMMHHSLLHLDDRVALFENSLEATVINNVHYMKKNGLEIKRGNSVFIPWDPIKEDKIYFYSDTMGESQWKLPKSWAGIHQVYLYKLNSHGSILASVIPVNKSDNSVSLQAEPKQGYVVYKIAKLADQDMLWGEGSGISNPGFDAGLAKWTADSTSAKVVTLPYGQDVLKLNKKTAARQLLDIAVGTVYDVSVWVEVHGQGKATLKVGGREISITESKVKNFFDNTDRYNTYFQRLKIPVKADSKNLAVELLFDSYNDTSFVYFDDVRIVKRKATEIQNSQYLLFEDFENIDEGWSFFIPSKPSAFKTHLSERNEPYTHDHISGTYALKTWNERNGEVYRTAPTLVQLKPQKKYQVGFDYKVSHDNAYELVVRSKKDDKTILRTKLSGAGSFKESFTTGAEDDYYIAVDKLNNGILVIDNFWLSD